MPVVPFNPQGLKAATAPVDDPWVLMAAAQMDADGRLMEPEAKAEPEDRKDG